MPLLFAYGKNRFSHDVAHMYVAVLGLKLATPGLKLDYQSDGLCQDWAILHAQLP